jgi:hypothetical protein
MLYSRLSLNAVNTQMSITYFGSKAVVTLMPSKFMKPSNANTMHPNACLTKNSINAVDMHDLQLGCRMMLSINLTSGPPLWPRSSPSCGASTGNIRTAPLRMPPLVGSTTVSSSIVIGSASEM